MKTLALAALLAAAAQTAEAAPVADELLLPLRGGQRVGVIVEFEAGDIDPRERRRLPERYSAVKDRVMRDLRRADIEATLDFSHLPMSFKELRSEAALRALAAQPGVRAVHPDRLYQHALAQSLPLMAQSVVAGSGLRGWGSTVAVIDDGIDLAHSAFGNCTAVATPASCRIAAMQTFVANPGAGSAHGSNVAAIVIGVAPEARVASLDVFSASGALTSSLLNAINWAIAQRESLNIVALNMSLGDGTHQSAPCGDPVTNPFATAITNARSAGISVVVAAGNNAYNNGSFSPGLSRPACTPGAISVGAVYDSALGGMTWFNGQTTQCTDAGTHANQIVCFSNSASYLSLLAPGALITAGGSTFGGTSQAAPHVAGALAVLRAGFPGQTPAAIEARLSASGTTLTDTRSGWDSPTLNLQAAAASLSADTADVPTLPEWGVWMLAGLLVWCGLRSSAPFSAAGGNG